MVKKENIVGGNSQSNNITKKQIIITVGCVGILVMVFLYFVFIECDNTQCKYKKIKKDLERADFICSHLVEEGDIYHSLYEMSSNIQNATNSYEYTIDYENGKLKGRLVGKLSNELNGVICKVPVEFCFFSYGVFDYCIELILRPYVDVDLWEDFILGKNPFQIQKNISEEMLS